MIARLKAITEKTYIPISLVLAIIGGVVWLTTLHANVDELKSHQSDYKAELHEIKSDLKAMSKNIQEINTRTSRIEGKLDR